MAQNPVKATLSDEPGTFLIHVAVHYCGGLDLFVSTRTLETYPRRRFGPSRLPCRKFIPYRAPLIRLRSCSSRTTVKPRSDQASAGRVLTELAKGVRVSLASLGIVLIPRHRSYVQTPICRSHPLARFSGARMYKLPRTHRPETSAVWHRLRLSLLGSPLGPFTVELFTASFLKTPDWLSGDPCRHEPAPCPNDVARPCLGARPVGHFLTSPFAAGKVGPPHAPGLSSSPPLAAMVG